METRKLRRYLALAIAAMALIYGWFALVGITDLGNFNHGIRNVLIGVVLVFLSECLTGRSLLHPSWRPGLLIFYFWLGAFSYIGARSGGTWGIRVEVLNDDVLTLIPVLVLTFLLEYIGSLKRLLKPVLSLFNFLLIGYFSLGVFVYITYYKIFDAGFTHDAMISVLLTNFNETKEFLLSHLGAAALVGVLGLFILYMILTAVLIYKGNREDKGNSLHSLKMIGIGILVIAALVPLARGIPRTFPSWSYRVAHKYIMGSKAAMKKHDENLKDFHFVGETPKMLNGSVIVVIGESAAEDHMKAFNPSYPAETTPWLSKEEANPDFFLFDKTYTSFPLTEKALAYYLTNINQYNGRNRNESISLTDVANQIGYPTYFISNQSPAPGNIALELTTSVSKKVYFTRRPGSDDGKVLDELKKIPDGEKAFIVIHLEGSHDRYKDRVPPDFTGIQVDGHSEKVNDYDSSILYTDDVLKRIYDYGKDHLNMQAMVYASDHGEDMEYFHGDGKFTWEMARIPLFVYLSDSYQKEYPETAKELALHKDDIFTNDLMYDLVCGILRAPNTGYDAKYDQTSPEFSFTKDQATTRYGEIRIVDDPQLK